MTFRSLIELDARLSDRLRVAEQPGLLRTLAVLFAHSGDSWFWAPALIALWFFSGSTWRRWEAAEFAGIVALAAIVMSVKFSVRRRRPQGDWGGIYRNSDPHSFPSGHAARAFLIAVLATGLAPAWLVAALWVWAPLVSLARVAMGVHYLSDVAAGAALGTIVGILGLQVYPFLFDWLANLTGFPLW
ncbi:MAG: phosphatase PAP2 family protein [Chloroflexota bacterium]